MKYMLLIHQGSAPTPRSPEEWERLPEDERNAVYAAYGGAHGIRTSVISTAVERRATKYGSWARASS
jgi:hypothetical protein